MCPGNSRVRGLNWIFVGCKRGDIKRYMSPIELCPYQGELPDSNTYDAPTRPTSNMHNATFINERAQDNLQHRFEILKWPPQPGAPRLARHGEDIDEMFNSAKVLPFTEVSHSGAECQNTSYSILQSPRDHCRIKEIIWALHDHSVTKMKIPSACTPKFLLMLRSAAIYEAKHDEVRAMFNLFFDV